MADQNLVQQTATTTPADGDILYTVVDPGATPLDRKITWTTIKAFLKTYFDTLFIPIDYNNSLFRQAIINGNFDVWQRGTSFDNPNAVYTVDRFKCINGVDTNVKVLRSTDVPNSSSLYSMRTEVMTATGGASSISYIIQKIEDYSKFVGKVVTLSVWAKCDAGVSGSILIQDDVGGSSSTAVSATTWTKYTASYTVNTGITYLQVVFNFPRDGITVGKGIYFSQVQLCAGSVALPFQPKSFAEELRDCQRYCYGITTGVTYEIISTGGIGQGATTAQAYINLPVPMRIVPALTATAGDYLISDGTNVTDVTSLALDVSTSSKMTAFLNVGAASGIVQYRPICLLGDGTVGRVLILSAEL